MCFRLFSGIKVSYYLNCLEPQTAKEKLDVDESFHVAFPISQASGATLLAHYYFLSNKCAQYHIFTCMHNTQQFRLMEKIMWVYFLVV